MIVLKNSHEIELMRESGKLAVDTMQKVIAAVRPGVTTAQLDKIAFDNIQRLKAKPSFLGYGGFPASICTSVNDEVVHGIPGNRRLEEGDIVSIDLGVVYQGFNSDMARTVPVGSVSRDAERLMADTKKCFFLGMAQAIPGNHICDIGRAIQTYAEAQGLGVVRDLVGHGVGMELHESPNVPNYADKTRGALIKRGMTIAIEPMINLGTWRVSYDDNDWTVRTRDGELSSHYENTIAVTDNGPDILTLMD